jgi:hypothetical protein
MSNRVVVVIVVGMTVAVFVVVALVAVFAAA